MPIMSDEPLPGTMDCPACGGRIEFDRRFAPWCAGCEWNVGAGMDPGPKGRLDRRRAALARRLASGTLRGVAARSVDRPPRRSAATLLLWAMALTVIAAWIALTALGVLLVLSGHLVVVIAGAIVLLISFVSRPRFGAAPDDTLDRAEAPETYRLLDDISAAMSAPRIAAIGLDGDWNAGTYRFGLRQRHAITFGLPFWRALSDEGRLAILAHEVAHGVNGDTARGGVVGTALRTLVHWIEMTEPDALADESDGFGGLVSIPGNLLLLGISLVLLALAVTLFTLAFAPSMRAELYADRLAARTAGSAAAIDGLETSRHAPAYLRAIQRIALQRTPMTSSLFDELLAQVAATPAGELERLRRQDAHHPYRFDQVHPPTSERVALLQQSPVPPGPLVADLQSRMRAIDREWEHAEPRIASELIDEYLAALS